MKTLEDLYDLKMEEAIRSLGDAYESFDIDAFTSSFLEEHQVALRSHLDESSADMLLQRRTDLEEFNGYCESIWSKGFDLLEAFVEVCSEFNLITNEQFREWHTNDNELMMLLFRLQGRACQISNEIICLLKSGFPDAAHARWRALHEVAATSLFIEKHGRECAVRFNDHLYVDSYDSIRELKKYEHRLNEKAPSQEVIEEHKALYDAVIGKYGKGFGCHYGWAAYVFPDRLARQVGFGSIEKDVGLDHMRPYYKWASQNVHSGSKGTKTRLGLKDEDQSALLIGASTYGFTDPAHAMAISLTQSTLPLLRMNQGLSTNLNSLVLLGYCADIGATFLEIQKNL